MHGVAAVYVSHDLAVVATLATRVAVPVEGTFREQFRGGQRPGALRPGHRGPQPADGCPGRARRLHQVVHQGPHHHVPLAEELLQLGDHAALRAQHHAVRRVLHVAAGDHPAVVHQTGERLHPGIPGAAHLGGTGVHLGGGEGHLAGVVQHLVGQHRAVLGRQQAQLLLHHGNGGAHQVNGLVQRDLAGQGAWRRREDAGRLEGGLRVVGHPLHEPVDAAAGHHPDPGAVLRVQLAEGRPVADVEHLGRRKAARPASGAAPRRAPGRGRYRAPARVSCLACCPSLPDQPSVAGCPT